MVVRYFPKLEGSLLCNALQLLIQKVLQGVEINICKVALKPSGPNKLVGKTYQNNYGSTSYGYEQYFTCRADSGLLRHTEL
eukprot:4123712-Amphidinium_carterae.1